MSPLRYVVMKMAHERNPYPANSSRWAPWNDGFIDEMMPEWPSRWVIAYGAIIIGPMFIPGAIVLLAGWIWLWP